MIQSSLGNESDETIQESKEAEEVGEQNQNKYESYDCGVCYKELNMDDNVVTKCNHHYCKDCFYRWIQTNASCPMCRTPITSNAHLTEDQLQMEISEEYAHYVDVLTRSNIILRSNMRLKENHQQLLQNTNCLLKRQISLREQMDISIAATNGIIACRERLLNKNKSLKQMFTDRYLKSFNKNLYFQFHKSYKEEKRRLIELNFNPKIFQQNIKINHNKKIVIKKRVVSENVEFNVCRGEKKNKRHNIIGISIR